MKIAKLQTQDPYNSKNVTMPAAPKLKRYELLTNEIIK